MRQKFFIVLISTYSLLSSNVYGNAKPARNYDTEIELSQKTTAAWICAYIAPDEKEAERLFTVGLEAGRKFGDFAFKNEDEFSKHVRPKTSMFWHYTYGGPSIDFILGSLSIHIYNYVVKEKMMDNKSKFFMDQNCKLIK